MSNLSDKLKKLGTPLHVEWQPRPEVLCARPIPKPLHGVVPREILGPAWWRKTRNAAYASTNFHCIVCKVPKHKAKYRNWLEGHEVYDIDYLLGRSVYVETVPLCHLCHNYVHTGRLLWLLQTGQIHQGKYVDVIQHGDKVLRDNGISKPEAYQGPSVKWHEWRLVVDGNEYPPLYATEDEWIKAHGNDST